MVCLTRQIGSLTDTHPTNKLVMVGGGGGAGGLLSLVSGALSGGGGNIRAGAPRNMYPRGDPRNCLSGNPKLNILQVVPGIGWDNLRNSETGILTSFSYSQCKVTYDRRYLIPDETFAIPIKTSTIDYQAELFDHWDAYKSVTSRSINAGFDFFGKIGGEILSLLKSNDTESADYAAQILIRDYGTHCITSIDAGAVLIKEDNLKSTIMSNYKGRADSLSTAAGVEFYDMLKLRASAGFSSYSGDSDLKAYRQNRTSSRLYTYGGPPYKLGMNLSRWENDLMNNLVATDRSGKPSHSLSTTQSLKPEVTTSQEVFLLRRLVKSAVSQYYHYNTHTGCKNPKAPNLDHQTNNGAPGVCKEPSANYTFGGVFQSCRSNGNDICGKLLQKNPLTGGYSCPKNFKALLLQLGTERSHKMRRVCVWKRKCTFFVFNCHDVDDCTFVPSVEIASYQTYWCAPNKKNPPKFGYMFGGIYSNDIQNPITRSCSCPTHFLPLRMGERATVCVSEDYELGHQFSLPFGGFFSCVSGNVLAGNGSSEFLNNPKDWPMRCPGGFTQHLALTEKGCRVNFCVKAGSLLRASDLELVLPPFDPKPTLRKNSTSDLFSKPAVAPSGSLPIKGVPPPLDNNRVIMYYPVLSSNTGQRDNGVGRITEPFFCHSWDWSVDLSVAHQAIDKFAFAK
uniref:Macrophage expressed protein n=1 Tax=Suberites domuncula TaxID=55567 RepID=Q4W1E5_SUBDO|nr:macrophage expressed protein [Suberites domuncula]